MSENLTPSHLRCSHSMSCPGVYRLEEGLVMIVGKYASRMLRREIVNPDGRLGDGESAVVIEDGLLDDYVRIRAKELENG